MELQTVLHTLGIEGLRPFQKEALNTLFTGRRLLTLMPTSASNRTLRSNSTRCASCRTRALPPPA